MIENRLRSRRKWFIGLSIFFIFISLSLFLFLRGHRLQVPLSKRLSVPFTPQWDGFTCGPASLSMLLAFYGTQRTVKEISNLMAQLGDGPYPDQGGELGVPPWVMMEAARRYGFPNTSERFGLTELKNAVMANHPVIIHIFITAHENPRYYPCNTPAYTRVNAGHFLVVAGLQTDERGNIRYVVVNDSSRGPNIRYTWRSVDAAWADRERRIIRLR